MTTGKKSSPTGCAGCRESTPFPVDFSMAFQPIVHIGQQRVFAYEALVRDVHQDPGRRAIIRAILQLCRELEMDVIAEGVETEAEVRELRSLGIELFQGYLFARPAFRQLARVSWEAVTEPA